MMIPFFQLATILEYSFDWNLVLIIISGCSLLGVAIFVERLIHLRKAEIDTNRFLLALRRTIKEGDIVDAIELCERTGGSIAHIVRAGISRHNKEREQIENAMEVTGMIEIAQLEKNAKILSIIAHVAPLIGLLGTVLGFIHAFSDMRMSGLVDISATRIGEAMEYALISTAAGIAVAIPSVIAYNYIVSRVESFVLEIQTTSSEIVDLLLDRQEELGL